MEIAVVGGGMFGVTSAIELAKEGADVTLFERHNSIIREASRSNQWRLHRGYHYPKSDATARACKRGEQSFRDLFEKAVITENTHYYAVASDSWVPSDEYLEFCGRHNLEYTRTDTELVSSENVDTVLEVEENHVDPDRIRTVAAGQMESNGVKVRTGVSIKRLRELREYDHVVIATYASHNELLSEHPSLRRELRFEVCEIPLVELPDAYKGNNIIVVYGPYMSVDHWGDTELFVMGDYRNMVHAENVGYAPEVPDKYEGLVNQGRIMEPEMSNFGEFRRTGQKYIDGVADAVHRGSMFTIRTKLPDVGDTDARPSVVSTEGSVTTVFGGKLVTSVETAHQVVEEVIGPD